MRKVLTYVPAFILLLGCAILWQPHAQRSVPLAGSLSSILTEVPGYKFRDLQVSDEERRVAGMTDYVARVYGRDSLEAFTTLVSYYDHQEQGKTIHSPRNCLPGAGWEIVRSGTRSLDVDGVQHVVNQYILKKGPEMAVAYYWYQGRGRVVANEYRVKWNLLRDAALLGHTEEALVRVVVPVAGASALGTPAADKAYADASVIGDQIATRMVREVARVLPGNHPSQPAT
jgi:EpsI family protein